MIYTTDQILINGTNKIYNGYIYNLDYQPSFGPNPSYCTLNLISEDGTYSITSGDLQVLATDNIQIGTGLSLNMYPVQYKEDMNPAGKILSIKYIDTSIILDKKIVVLNGRQGNNGTANSPISAYISSSGTQTSTTGTVSSFVYPNDQYQGSCYIPVGKELLNLNQNAAFQVLQVLYTFPDLMDAINANGLVIAQDSLNLIANTSQYYATSYFGSLRNVLSQWCADLGYTFYWENNQLHFIDLTTQLILDTSAYDAAAQSAQSTEVSIEDTVGRVACAFFGQDFSRDTVPFSQDTQMNMKVVSLASLNFSPEQITSVTAAFCGYDVFFAYHFLQNNNYCNGIIGLSGNPIEITDPTTISTISKDIQALDVNNNSTYGTMWFGQITKSNFAQQSYQQFLNISTQVGKYYTVPLSYGDYKKITNSQYKIEFYPGTGLAGFSPLGQLAGYLGSDGQTLDQFLLGVPFNPNNQTNLSNPNLTNQNIQASSSEVRTQDYIDSTAGYAIATIDNQPWYFDKNPITQPILQSLITTDGTVNLFPKEIPPTEQEMQKIMTDAGNAIDYSSLPVSSPTCLYEWSVFGAPTTSSVPFYFNIISPEFDYLTSNFKSIVNNVTISDPYLITFPKIEEFFRSETDKEGNTVNCNSNVIKNEMNYREITNGDMTILGHPGGDRFVGNIFGVSVAYPAAPTPQNIYEAFQLFTQNLTLSKVDPTIVKTYSFPYIDVPNNYNLSLGKGLIGLNVRIDEKGITSNYTVGTRLMQVPNLSVIQQNLAWLRGTNQSRYLPYGAYNNTFGYGTLD